MTGEDLKPYLNHLDVSYAAVARKLGMKNQSLDNIFNTKDIKTGLIERLSKLYKVPVSYFYSATLDNPGIKIQAEGSSAASLHGNATVNIDSSLYAEKIRYLEAIIIEKDERIKELKQCLEILKER